MTFTGAFPLEDVPMDKEVKNKTKEVKTDVQNEQSFKSEKKIDGHFENKTASGVVLNNYKVAKEELKAAQEKEKELKTIVLQHVGELHEGTNRFTTNFYALKITKTPTLSIVAPDMNYFGQCLQWIDQCVGAGVSAQLVTWKPSLNKKVYDELPEEIRKVFNQFVELKYNSPTFTLEDL